MNFEKKKKRIYFFFIPDRIGTRNRPVCRQVIYPLNYRYRQRTFYLNYSKVHVCFYKKLRFKGIFVIGKYLYKQRLSIKPP